MNTNGLSILWVTIGLALIVSSVVTFLFPDQLSQPEIREAKRIIIHDKPIINTQKIEIKHKPTSDNLAMKSEKLIESTEQFIDPSAQMITSEHKENTYIEENVYLNEDGFLEESIKSLIAIGIEDDFEDLNLSEEELQDLTEAVISIRVSMLGLRNMERSSENAESLNQLQVQLNEATDDFKQITGMSLNQLILRAPADGGLDNNRPDDEEIVFEYLDDHGE